MDERKSSIFDIIVFLIIFAISSFVKASILGIILLAVAIIYSLVSFLKLGCTSIKFKILLIILALIFLF